MNKKEGAIFLLFAHPLSFTLRCTDRFLKKKIPTAPRTMSTARTIPTIDPTGGPRGAAFAGAVFLLEPVFFVPLIAVDDEAGVLKEDEGERTRGCEGGLGEGRPGVTVTPDGSTNTVMVGVPTGEGGAGSTGGGASLAGG